MAGADALACSNRSRTRDGADAHEHLDEVGARDGEEGDARLTGDGPGQQGLARARRAEQQHALGDLGPHGLELGRRLEELLDLLQLLDRLVRPRHVGEGDLGRVLGHLLGLGLAELHDPVPAALHAVHDEQEGADEQEERQQRLQERPPQRVLLVVDLDLGALGAELGHEGGRIVLHVGRAELVAVLELALDGAVAVGNGDLGHLARGHALLELVEAVASRDRRRP